MSTLVLDPPSDTAPAPAEAAAVLVLTGQEPTANRSVCPSTPDGRHRMATGPNGESYCTECGYAVW